METEVKEQVKLREARKGDIPDLIKLIETIFVEYDMAFDVDEEVPDFLDFENHYGDKYHLSVAQHPDTGILAGCTALKFEEKLPRLSRVYVRKKDRGKGIGKRLVKQAETLAAEAGYKWIHLWTDTRFKRAHRFYKNLGYEYTGRAKPLNDINNSYEYHFLKKLPNHT